VSAACRERLVIAPRDRRRTVLNLIRSARRRLALSIFRCDDDAVLGALAAAVRRGVEVRVIITGRARASARDLEYVQACLVRHGADVRRCPRPVKYHAKYLVVDDATALVASLNLTAKCFERTCDFMAVTGDATVVSGVSALFTADWSMRPVTLTGDQADRLIVGPEQRPRDRFASLVRGARRRIRLIDAKLADSRMLSLLESRRRMGIAVEVKGADDLGPFAAHGKLLIVDDTTAVLGSIALSEHALDGRRELALVTSDPASIRQLDAFWRSLSARRDAGVRNASGFQEARP
jgi:phosphatidylserine/phosphatidylglycerophosphate/cardiolipin synthase-like enzyme